MNNQNQVAYLIRQYRKAQRLSQQELAEKAGISRSALIKYENQQQEPSIQALARIATALSIDTTLLIPKNEKKERIKHIFNKSNIFDEIIKELGYEKDIIYESIEENHYYKLISANETIYISIDEINRIEEFTFDIVAGLIRQRAFDIQPTNPSSEPDEHPPTPSDE